MDRAAGWRVLCTMKEGARNTRARKSGGRCYQWWWCKAKRCSPDSGLKRWETQSFFISVLSSISFHPAKQSSSFLFFIARFSVPSTLLCRCVRPLILVPHLKRWKKQTGADVLGNRETWSLRFFSLHKNSVAPVASRYFRNVFRFIEKYISTPFALIN